MRMGLFLTESFRIAVNRSATQLASIVIVAWLGAYSTHVLAAFTLALAGVAIPFIVITTIQIGAQTELISRYVRGCTRSMYCGFFATLGCVLCASAVTIVAGWIVPPPFGAVQSADVRVGAGEAYRTLLLCLPLVACYSAVQSLMESSQRASLAFRVKSCHVLIQLAIVAWYLYGREEPATAGTVAVAYLLADGINSIVSILAVIVLVVDRRKFWHAARASLRPWRRRTYYRRAISLGLPMSVGAIAQKYLFYRMGLHCAALSPSTASALSILVAVVFLLQIPVTGVAHLATLRLALAAGRYDRIQFAQTLVMVKRAFVGMTVIIGLTGWLTLGWLLRAFTNEAGVASHITGLAYLFPVYFLMSCLLALLLAMLRGLSDSLRPQLVVNVGLLLMITSLLHLYSGASFVELVSAFCISSGIAVGFLACRWRTRSRSLVVLPGT